MSAMLGSVTHLHAYNHTELLNFTMADFCGGAANFGAEDADSSATDEDTFAGSSDSPVSVQIRDRHSPRARAATGWH